MTGVNQLANIVASIQILDVNKVEVVEDTTGCEQGVIGNFLFIFISMLLSDYLSGVLETYHVSGVYIPANGALVDNNRLYSWDLVEMLEEEVKLTQSAVPNAVNLKRDRNITVHSEVAADRESIIVPFGIFPLSIKVIQEMKLPVTMWTTSSSMSGKVSIQLTQWYEPYIGLLKMQIDSASILIVEGISVSVLLDSTIALTKFYPGKNKLGVTMFGRRGFIRPFRRPPSQIFPPLFGERMN